VAIHILVTGAAGGSQGSTGLRVVHLLVQQGLAVRAFVHHQDERSERLRQLGAEVVQGDLLEPNSIRQAMQGIRRAYFTYPVADGLLEATTSFAQAAREANLEMVVNMSQLQSTPEAPSFRNLQHRLADRIFDWAQVGAVHLQAPPFFENLRALVMRSVAEQDTIFLPWGDGDAVFPLVAAEDVATVAATLLAGPVGERQPTGYELVGATPTVAEMTRSFGTALGRPVRYVEISDERWSQAVEGYINPHALDHLSHLWRFFRTSGMPKGEHGFAVSSAIQSLTGRPPESLEEFLRANRAAFSSAASAPSNLE
jgi:uncharacterized protein YbjT (DUF2867 family)